MAELISAGLSVIDAIEIIGIGWCAHQIWVMSKAVAVLDERTREKGEK